MAKEKSRLQLTSIKLKNFRCFTDTVIELDKPRVLIEGHNGIGKTSFLEALYYLCYLRSFRTASPKELVRFGQDGFFIKISFEGDYHEQPFAHDIQVGFSGSKRLVKVDQKPVSSYKELMNHYRVVCLTEDDLSLIKGSPQGRRTFIDQMILLQDPDYVAPIREFRQVLDNRNAFLAQRNHNKEMYDVLTEQLWNKSNVLAQMRIRALEKFSQQIDAVAQTYMEGGFSIHFSYKSKLKPHESYPDFYQSHSRLHGDEVHVGRSLFGAHLDDFLITFQDKKSKSFASRGQQKLIVLLMKIAQVSQCSGPSVFLLDDFMTDFDEKRAEQLFQALCSLDSQLIFTSPVTNSNLADRLVGMGGQVSKLTY